MQKFYTKDGDKFIEAGYEFTGFPSNGVWLVEDGKQNCIVSMGDKPKYPSKEYINYMIFQDELQETISKAWDGRALSVRDISKIACDFFAEKAGVKNAEDIFEF